MSDWIEAPLSQLVTFQKGRKVDTSPFAREGFAAYLGASGIEGGKDGYAATQFAVIAKPTDTLMLWDGERSGLVGYGQSGVVASTVTKLTPNNQIDPRFLYYVLSDRFNWIQHRRTGTGVPHVPKDLGRILKLRYPNSSSTQKKIAAILNSIDTDIEKTEALIEKYRQIKAGLMHDLFTRGVLPNGQLRPPRTQAHELYQETAIGWIPRDWQFTTCAKVCEKIIDCKNRTPPESPDGFPVIRTPNVRNGEFVDDDLLHTDELSYLIWTIRGKPQIGDIVITREAPVGEVCMIPDRHPNACLGQRMMLYRPNYELIEPRFFLYALQSPQIQNRLDLISGGSTVGHVRVGDIRDLWMFMPESRSEQELIVLSLDGITKNLNSELAHLGKLRSQKLGLMQDLLTGKVPVKIDGPITEAASG